MPKLCLGLVTCASGQASSNVGQVCAVILGWNTVLRLAEPNCKSDTSWGAVPRFNESSRLGGNLGQSFSYF